MPPQATEVRSVDADWNSEKDFGGNDLTVAPGRPERPLLERIQYQFVQRGIRTLLDRELVHLPLGRNHGVSDHHAAGISADQLAGITGRSLSMGNGRITSCWPPTVATRSSVLVASSWRTPKETVQETGS